MFRKLFCSALLCILATFSVFSQQQKLSDLLQKWHRWEKSGSAEPDTARVSLLNGIANIYIQNASDSALFFSGEALKMAELLQFEQGKAMAFSNFAKIHYIKGNYDLSLNNSLNALRISNRINYDLGKANAYNIIGLIYLAQKKLNPALKEFKKAAQLNQQLKNRNRLSANYFNIGLAYFENNQLDSAIHYLTFSKDLSLKINDQNMLAMANNRLGDYYLKLGQASKAIAMYFSVINNATYQSDWENTFAYAGLAECFNKRGEYQKAVEYGLKAHSLAKKTNTKWDFQRSAKVLHETYLALGDYKQAYDYLLIDKAYSDSLFNEKKEKEINALSLVQKQAENEVLVKKNQLEHQKNRVIRIVIFVVMLIAIFLVVLVVIIYKNARKKNSLNQMLQKKSDDIAVQKQLIEEQNTKLFHLNKTKDQLFSIIGHDLRSPMAAILGSLQLLKDENLKPEEVQPFFRRFFDQVTSTNLMLENLLLWANSQRSGISVKPDQIYLYPVFKEVLGVFDNIIEEKKIKVEHVPFEHEAVMADPNHVRIIFQNILVNAIKFTRRNGSIVITYHETDLKVRVSVKDNGIGMSAEKVAGIFKKEGKEISSYGTMNEKGIGIGLVLVKNFVDQNNADISIFSEENKGTEVVIEFLKYKEAGENKAV
ncbi:tetratricopeptide repeat protein [Emticicia sp. CRIBPO]|uniref:tetratricopeptide repeat-containing sensor histidine kinase n=1 Tax=Emticicia sp. CRIBPO TaxID=2683258 RepID=UPI001412740E|nr:tetratricopeptide repeat-containing sensor histidine kinase [Emticicia sp. CRIBPO]NBA86870.1 tetratricopeptide repeat protein [Emticicia sp. CRIBPO]